MSALGQKRSFDPDLLNVRFAPIADIHIGHMTATRARCKAPQ